VPAFFSRWYRPGATKAQAWYSSHGTDTNSAAKNASFTGAKKGDTTPVAISCPPAGSFASSGFASQA
jgi:hypothetical protein